MRIVNLWQRCSASPSAARFVSHIHSVIASLIFQLGLLFTKPTIILFSLWVSFAWSILYLAFGSIRLIFTASHHFTHQQSSAVFSAICIGSIISTLISIFRGLLFKQSSQWVEQSRIPKTSLYFSCVESLLLPIGLIWLGWTQFKQIPWIIPAMAIGCVTMGIYSIYLATIGYLTDTYHQYTSSALAAQSFCEPTTNFSNYHSF
jgi:hypothetical protein